MEDIPRPIGDELSEEERAEEAPAPGRSLFPDSVKKAILAGVGALFMTEEGARKLARDWKLPKELIGFVAQQTHAAKDEVLRVFADEIRRFLESEAMQRELGKVLTSMAVEVHAEIRFKPAEDGSKRPVIKASVVPKPRRRRAGRR